MYLSNINVVCLCDCRMFLIYFCHNHNSYSCNSTSLNNFVSFPFDVRTCLRSSMKFYMCDVISYPCAVYVSPAFDVRPKNTTAFVNDNLWLHCNATGVPKPKICWGRYERIGRRLDRSRFIPYHNGTLHIKRVRTDDQDSYFCLAANRAGMKATMFNLIVKGKLTRLY